MSVYTVLSDYCSPRIRPAALSYAFLPFDVGQIEGVGGQRTVRPTDEHQQDEKFRHRRGRPFVQSGRRQDGSEQRRQTGTCRFAGKYIAQTRRARILRTSGLEYDIIAGGVVH